MEGVTVGGAVLPALPVCAAAVPPSVHTPVLMEPSCWTCREMSAILLLVMWRVDFAALVHTLVQSGFTEIPKRPSLLVQASPLT